MRRERTVETKWRNFTRGLNTLVAPNKLQLDELQDATNVVLQGEGFPTRRPGLDFYGDALTSGQLINNVYGYYNSSGTSELLAMQGGFLKRQNTLGHWSIVTGASFASGQLTAGISTANYLYLSNGSDFLTRYDGSTLVRFAEIQAPTTTFLSRGGSLASGQYIYSYRVSAFNSIGETLAAGAATIAMNTDRNVWNTDTNNLIAGRSILVNWSKVSTARGYNIYGFINGSETLIDSVQGENVTSYTDYGIRTPSNFFSVPQSNTTGGPKGKFVTEYKGSLFIGNDPGNPSRLYYSAGADKPDNFSLIDGGGWIDVSKNNDDGHLVTARKFQDSLIVYKQRSTWKFDFTQDVLAQLVSLKPDTGAISHYSVNQVENDQFLTASKAGKGPARYALGNEPNILNVLRTNEISTRVRPQLEGLVPDNYERANSQYFDSKDVLFYTQGGGDINNVALVYDRERLGFTFWTNIHADASIIFYDTDGNEHFLIADNTDYSISEISSSFTDDKGEAIEWSFRARDEDFGNTLGSNRYDRLAVRLKDIGGEVHFKLWTNTTDLIFDQTENLTTGSDDTAFGVFQWGDYQFGTNADEENTNVTENVIIRRIIMKRLGRSAIANTISFGMSGMEVDSSATLLDLQISGTPRSKNYYSRIEEIY